MSDYVETATALDLLSAVPCFDVAIGVQIASLAEEQLAEQDLEGWAVKYLNSLSALGGIERVGELYRVAEPIRLGNRSITMEQAPNLLRRVLNLFADHAEGAMRTQLSRVMGVRGSIVAVQTIRAVANPDEAAEFDHLIDLVHRSSRLGRYRDAGAAAELMRTYTQQIDRRIVFLEGLSAWQTGDKARAASAFREVLKFGVSDKADGMAAHLFGVYLHEQGRVPEALELMERAERSLAQARDLRGLAITKASHGRILRDSFKNSGDSQYLVEALRVFEQGLRHLEKVSSDPADMAQTRGRIGMGIAVVRGDLEQYDLAIADARLAAREFRDGSVEEGWALITLARLLRDSGDVSSALELLEARWGLDGFANSWDIQTATALVVLSSLFRRDGKIGPSLIAARQSLEIGEFLGNQRQVAISLLNLADTEIADLPPGATTDSAEVRRVRGYLYRAQSIFAALKSPRDWDYSESLFSRLPR
jgi:tetratricopeptide (TPR) repeat protein